MEEKDWNALLMGAKNGDSQKKNQLFSNLSVTLRPFLQYRLRGWSVEDREDILQETLITIDRKLEAVESNPHKYAIGVLRNKIGS